MRCNLTREFNKVTFEKNKTAVRHVSSPMWSNKHDHIMLTVVRSRERYLDRSYFIKSHDFTQTYH